MRITPNELTATLQRLVQARRLRESEDADPTEPLFCAERFDPESDTGYRPLTDGTPEAGGTPDDRCHKATTHAIK